MKVIIRGAVAQWLERRTHNQRRRRPDFDGKSGGRGFESRRRHHLSLSKIMVLFVLIELELINFMSYKHAKILFHNGFNILFGKKGSGKTAVLEAIRLLFGGIGKERVQAIAECVRYGEQKAIIRARLKNILNIGGREIRLLEEYPLDEFVLERHIYDDGKSVFKLNGKNISKREILKILAKVNISPRNTLFFLPQERVNDWLRMKPAERIDLFLSAIGLKELKDKLRAVREEIAKKAKEKEKYLKLLFELEEKLEEKKKRILVTKETKDFFDRYYNFKLAYLFSKKSIIEEEIKGLKNREMELKNKLEELNRLIVGRKELLEDIKRQIEELEKKLSRMQTDEIKLELKKEELENNLRNFLDRMSAFDDKVREYQKKLKEIEKAFGVADISGLEKLKEKYIKQLKEIEKSMEKNEIIKEIKRLEEKKASLKNEKEIVKKELSDAQKEFESVLLKLDNSGTIKKVFRKAKIYRDYEEIFGPIALEISFKVSEAELEDLAPLIEALFGINLLRAFIAVDAESYKSFINFLKSLKYGNRFEVLNFSLRNYNYNEIIKEYERKRRKLVKEIENKLRSGYYPDLNPGVIAYWICDVIEAPPPVKALIEAKFWDVPIVVDIYAATSLITKLGLKKVVTLDGFILEYHKIGPFSYISTKVVPEDLAEESIFLKLGIGGGAKVVEYIKSLEERIGEFDMLIREVEAKISELEKAIPDEYKELYRRKKRIMSKIMQIEDAIDEIERLKRVLGESPERKKKVQEVIDKIQRELDSIYDEIERLKQEKEETLKKLGELKAKREEILSGKIRGESDIENIERELEEIPAKIKGLERRKNEIQNEIEKTKKEMHAIYSLLLRLGILKEEDWKDYVKKRIVKEAMLVIDKMSLEEIEKSLEILERDIEKVKEDVFKRETKLEELEEMMEQIEEVRKKMKELDEEIKNIRKFYNEELKELLSELKEKVSRINEVYKKVLSLLQADGEISIEGESIDNLRLKITASIHRDRPTELEKGNFSSGEKTTIIMALIISLLSVNTPPIFMFDEFDVFLDDISLREVLFLLRTILGGIQGLITTTHREEIIEFGDKVFYVEFNDKEKASKIYPINIRKG